MSQMSQGIDRWVRGSEWYICGMSVEGETTLEMLSSWDSDWERSARVTLYKGDKSRALVTLICWLDPSTKPTGLSMRVSEAFYGICS